MKIEAMRRFYHKPKAQEDVQFPVTMEVEFPEPVTRNSQMIEGVRRIKQTGWYRSIKRNDIHFTPLGSKEKVIFIAVGSAAAIGSGFLIYKALKERYQQEDQSKSK